MIPLDTDEQIKVENKKEWSSVMIPFAEGGIQPLVSVFGRAPDLVFDRAVNVILWIWLDDKKACVLGRQIKLFGIVNVLRLQLLQHGIRRRATQNSSRRSDCRRHWRARRWRSAHHRRRRRHWRGRRSGRRRVSGGRSCLVGTSLSRWRGSWRWVLVDNRRPVSDGGGSHWLRCGSLRHWSLL